MKIFQIIKMQKLRLLTRRFSTSRIIGNDKLVFSLPCLSESEYSYLTGQVNVIRNNVETYVEPEYLLQQRFRAIAQAYDIPEDDECHPHVIKACEQSVWKHKGAITNYPIFKSAHVVKALELGVINGDVREMIKFSVKRLKFRLTTNTQIKFMLQTEGCKAKYRNRLLEIIDKLDLDLEHLLPDSDFTASGIDSTLYKSLLTECLGISSDQKFLSKYFNVSHKKMFALYPDPIEVVRTYYILKETLDINLDFGLNFVSMIGRVSALDLLLHLNVCYDLTDQTLSEEERKSQVISVVAGASDAAQVCDNLSIWHLSLPQCFHFLQRTGFTEEEVRRLWLSTNMLKDVANCVMDPSYASVESLVFLMQKKMEMLNKEGAKLGIADPVAKYKFIFNWGDLVEALKTPGLEDRLFSVKFGKSHIRLFEFPSKNILGSSTRALLLEYFGFTENREKEKIKEFNKIFSRLPYAKEVPLSIVLESLRFLESLHFSNVQIEKGFPVLFYEKEVLQRKIIEATDEMGPSWMEKDNALNTLHYLLEVESNFSFTQLYQGIISNFQKGLSVSEFDDLNLKDKSAGKETMMRKKIVLPQH